MLYYDKQTFKLVDKNQMRETVIYELDIRLPDIRKKINSEERMTLIEIALYALNRFSPLEAPEKI